VNLASVAPSFALLGDNLHVAGIIAHSDGSYNYIGPQQHAPVHHRAG